MFRESISTLPSCGSKRPKIMSTKVDLPEPDSPTKPTDVPMRMVIDTFERAGSVLVGYVKLTS